MAQRAVYRVLLAVGASLAMAGCTGYSADGNEYPDPEPVVEAPRPEPVQPVFEAPDLEPAPEHWACNYEPTMDGDWHNDVVCSNGSDYHRPYLREWDSFITESEIMESAAEYEAQLNASINDGS